MSDTSTLPAEYFHEDGRMKTLLERQAEQSCAERSAAYIASDVKARSAPKLTEDQKYVEAMDSDIEAMKRELRYAPPSDRQRILSRLQMYEKSRDERQTKIEHDARLAKLEADPAVKIVRDSVGAVARSGRTLYPHVAQNELDLLVAIGQSNDFEAADLKEHYFGQLARVEELSLAVEKQKASDAEIAKHRADAEHAKAALRVAESEQRLAKIQN